MIRRLPVVASWLCCATPAAAAPDVVIELFTTPDVLTVGENVDYEFQLGNIGTDGVQAQIDIYLTDDGLVDAAEKVYTQSSSLNAGATGVGIASEIGWPTIENAQGDIASCIDTYEFLLVVTAPGDADPTSNTDTNPVSVDGCVSGILSVDPIDDAVVDRIHHEVSITFATDVDPASFASRWQIVGDASGARAGDAGGHVVHDGARVTIYPAGWFVDGERVTCRLLSGIRSTADQEIFLGDRGVWSFTIDSPMPEDALTLAPIPARRHVLFSLPIVPAPGTRFADVVPGVRHRLFDLAGVEDPVIRGGRAYWLILGAPSEETTLSGPPLPASGEIVLAAGWNAIALPAGDDPLAGARAVRHLEAPVLLDAVGSPVHPSLSWYVDESTDAVNNGDYQSARYDVIDPIHGGALIWADEPCRLVYPPAGPRTAVSPMAREPADVRWSVQFTATDGTGARSWVRAGARASARDGYDRTDVLKPPLPDPVLRLSWMQSDAPWPELAEVWCRVENLPGGLLKVDAATDEIVLAWHVDGEPGSALFLVDAISGRSIDLIGRERVTLAVPASGERTFHLSRSPKGAVAPVVSGRLVLTQNPSRGGERVRFALADDVPVTVDLFAVDGRRVASLHRGRLPAGTHDVAVPHATLAPGTYFIRMVWPGGTEHVKLVRLP